jgi:hypothetical protein
MLNGDEDIETELIPQAAKDIMDEMDYMDVHVDIKKGLRYAQIGGNMDIAEEEYIRANNLVKKKKVKEDEDKNNNQNVDIQTFKWEDEFEVDVDEIRNEVMPYRTIEVIFNKKNIFINKQNPNPAGIRFDVYDKEKWFSVLKVSEQGITDPNFFKIWKQDIPAFYSFKNFLPYHTEEEMDQMKKTILSSVTTTIKIVRNQKNLNSSFKTVKNKYKKNFY